MSDLIDKAEALLPCPFCGGEAELWNAHDNRPAWIACMGRCAVLISKEHATDAEAIAAWNRRALPARGVGVKPLQWKQAGGNIKAGEGFSAWPDLIHAPLTIYRKRDGWWLSSDCKTHPTLDAAKAAAQADYEARIKAALSPAPDAREAALREAHDAIAEYPRISPDADEARHYDEQIEHSQSIILALINEART